MLIGRTLLTGIAIKRHHWCSHYIPRVMLMDEINAIIVLPTSAPLTPTPYIISGLVSYFLGVSRESSGDMLMGGTRDLMKNSIRSRDQTDNWGWVTEECPSPTFYSVCFTICTIIREG